MFLDKENLFSEEQAINDSAVSENVIEAGENAGTGEPLKLRIQVVEDFSAGGDAALQAVLQHSDSAEDGFTDLAGSFAVDVAELKAGYAFPINFAPYRCRKFLRLNYPVQNGPFTSGKITAGFVADVQTNG